MDKYIQLLKKAKEDFDSNTLISYSQFDKRAAHLKIQDNRHVLWQQIYDSPTEMGNRHIGLDAYFKLLEYEELKQARRSSLVATIIAIIAIVLNLLTLFFC